MRVLVILLGLLAFASSAAAQTTPHSKANHLTENATQNYVTANEMGDRLDEGIHNHAAFAMGDADVTLTAAQHFETSFFELTGANTAVRSLILRSECGGGTSPCEKRFTVWNNTTGGFDVTVKYATGATVNVSPSTVAVLQGDGTDIIQAGSLDIAQLTTEGSVDGANDLFVMWDASANALRGVLGENLPGGAGGGGGGAFGSFRGALVLYEGSSEALVIHTAEYVQWDTESFDTDDFWSASPNPSRFTIPAGVKKVMVGGSAVFGTSAGNRRWVAIHKNGSAIQECTLVSLGDGAGSDGVPSNTCIIEVGGGDYLQFEILVDSSSVTFDNGFWWIMVVDPVPVSRVSDNQLVNGDFQVCQRGGSACAFSAPANDSYTLDRFINLVEGAGGADHTQEKTVVPGAPGATTALKITAQTANDKFGIVQILPADRSNRLIGGTASLSFKVRSPSLNPIANVRACILSWTGTADAVISDVVSAWGLPGTDPTLATNWVCENTPADLAVTADAFGTVKLEAVPIDTAGTKNVGVFVWVDEDSAIGDILYITDLQLEPSSLASGYQRQDFEDVLAECLRHYYKTYDYANAPGSVTAAGALHASTSLSSTSLSNLEANFPRPMFAAPTVTWYSPATGTAGRVRNRTAAADVTVSSTLDAGQRNSGIPVAGAAVADGQRLAAHLTAQAEL